LSLLSRVQDFLTSFISNDSRKSRKQPSHAWYICCSMMGVRNLERNVLLDPNAITP
jgi:hypothetical protein